MLYQAAVILTYPAMLERALTPCALRGPAGTGPSGVGGHRRGGGTAQPDTSFAWWQLALSGSIHQMQGWEER